MQRHPVEICVCISPKVCTSSLIPWLVRLKVLVRHGERPMRALLTLSRQPNIENILFRLSWIDVFEGLRQCQILFLLLCSMGLTARESEEGSDSIRRHYGTARQGKTYPCTKRDFLFDSAFSEYSCGDITHLSYPGYGREDSISWEQLQVLIRRTEDA